MIQGKLLYHEINGRIVELTYERERLFLEFITPGIVRVGTSPRLKSHAIEKVPYEPAQIELAGRDVPVFSAGLFRVQCGDNGKLSFLTVSGEKICSDADADVSLYKDKKIRDYKEILSDEAFYGLGETTGFLNKKRYSYVMWNTDNPEPHTSRDPALYKSIPFYIGFRRGFAYGLFYDNHYKAYFDFGKTDSRVCAYAADDGELNYYFIYGPAIGDVVSRYTSLTGRTPLPAIWTLGYHQSRWSYRDAGEIRELVASFRRRGIPLDVVYFDIDYMDEYKVFTINKERFPDFPGLLAELKESGVKAVVIIDPGVKIEPGYAVYEEGKSRGFFARNRFGDIYQNVVWPGPSAYPSYFKKEVRDWWGRKVRDLLDAGVAGIWNDMNEPASFAGPLPDDLVFPGDDKNYLHTEAHNIYGHYMAKTAYDAMKASGRPFLITRACYAGTQKYSTVWTGDNHSLWHHLRMAIPQVCNLGLSGFAFCGVDIGGFFSDTTKELLIRWVQAACFFPLFRNHTAAGTRRQEPWAFDRETLDIYRRVVKLRYRFIPYLYDLFYQHENSGAPVIRPLVYHYPDDPETYNINDEYLVGESLLVAPVVEPGRTKRMVYLPKGAWYDFRTGKEYQGGYHIVDCPLAELAMFVKKGVILVGYPDMEYIDPGRRDTLIVEIYGDEAEYTHYYDDGVSFAYRDGDCRIYDIVYRDGSLEIAPRNDYPGGYKRVIVKTRDIETEIDLSDGKTTRNIKRIRF